MATPLTFRQTVTFTASRARIWDLLTNPAQTQQYMFGCAVQSDWQVGRPIRWVGHTPEGQEMTFVKGEIAAINPGQSLTYTMIDPQSGLPDIPANYARCTYTLEEVGDQTVLTIDQDFTGTAQGSKRLADAQAGWKHVIALMHQVVAG